MLTPILATDDPYETAAIFCRAGWRLEFETPPDGGDPLACVSLAGSRVLLGTSEPRFLAQDARPYRGAGVEFHVEVPAGEIDAIYLAHQATAPSASALEDQPWGERAFHVKLAGYLFLIASPPSRSEPAGGLGGLQAILLRGHDLVAEFGIRARVHRVRGRACHVAATGVLVERLALVREQFKDPLVNAVLAQ